MSGFFFQSSIEIIEHFFPSGSRVTNCVNEMWIHQQRDFFFFVIYCVTEVFGVECSFVNFQFCQDPKRICTSLISSLCTLSQTIVLRHRCGLSERVVTRIIFNRRATVFEELRKRTVERPE